MKTKAEFIKALNALAEAGASAKEICDFSLKYHLGQIITVDPAMIEIKKKIIRLAPTDIPVLIVGETGTGKELIAEALHAPRVRSGKFVAVNCAGIPDTLLEAEFFGVKRGAYTGAEDRKGLIEEAEGGTLFLDEIGDMPLMLQCKLLRVLQSRTFRRVGDTTDRPCTARIVSATHQDVTLAVQHKNFRSDLFYRLAGFVITVPPLRNRQYDDILRIVESVVKNDNARLDILSKMHGRSWPGNVRELINFVRASELMYEEDKDYKIDLTLLKPMPEPLA